jgi:hypothetical protein
MKIEVGVMMNHLMNPKVDVYLVEGCGRCPLGNTPQCKVNFWPSELRGFRRFLLECGLTEELKWGAPCYTFENSNVLMLSTLKDCCVIGFFKGSLLKDEQGILNKPGGNSQAARYIRFTSLAQVEQLEPLIKSYVQEAIDIEKAGLKVQFKKTEEFDIPEELQAVFETDPTFKTAFESLTPGRQRGYLLFFSAPKQSKTRVTRIEKYKPMIFAGKGMHD